MYEDKIHLDIKAKITSLEEKINSLECHKQDWNLQHQALSKLTIGSYNHPEMKEAIDKQRVIANNTPRPQAIETQIVSVRKEIETLWKEYYETEFFMPPMRLTTTITYEDKAHQIELRHLKDAKSSDAPLFLFISSQYPQENTKVLYDEQGKPSATVRYAQSSDTRGFLMKFITPILLDQPKEPDPKPVPQKPVFPTGYKDTRKCPKCQSDVYKELKMCPQCHAVLDETLLKIPEKKPDKKPKKILGIF